MKGLKIKKRKKPESYIFFAHHALLEILEQKPRGLEERGKKSKGGIS